MRARRNCVLRSQIDSPGEAQGRRGRSGAEFGRQDDLSVPSPASARGRPGRGRPQGIDRRGQAGTRASINADPVEPDRAATRDAPTPALPRAARGRGMSTRDAPTPALPPRGAGEGDVQRASPPPQPSGPALRAGRGMSRGAAPTRPSRSWRGCGAGRRRCRARAPRRTRAAAAGCTVSSGCSRARRVRHPEHVAALLGDGLVALRGTAMTCPSRARTSARLDRTFSYPFPRGAMTTTGIPSSMSAIGPCFISPAA